MPDLRYRVNIRCSAILHILRYSTINLSCSIADVLLLTKPYPLFLKFISMIRCNRTHNTSQYSVHCYSTVILNRRSRRRCKPLLIKYIFLLDYTLLNYRFAPRSPKISITTITIASSLHLCTALTVRLPVSASCLASGPLRDAAKQPRRGVQGIAKNVYSEPITSTHIQQYKHTAVQHTSVQVHSSIGRRPHSSTALHSHSITIPVCNNTIT